VRHPQRLAAHPLRRFGQPRRRLRAGLVQLLFALAGPSTGTGSAPFSMCFTGRPGPIRDDSRQVSMVNRSNPVCPGHADSLPGT